MPVAPPHPCRGPRCGELLRGRAKFCAQHQHLEGWHKSNRGLTAHQRGYGASWRRLRAQVLAEEPTCRSCRNAPSVIADHIVAKSVGGSDDRRNLQGLCQACSDRKTRREANAAKEMR